MGLYYASVVAMDRPVITLDVEVMDRANIDAVPSSVTFFAAALAELVVALRNGHLRGGSLPRDASDYRSDAVASPATPAWETYLTAYFGPKVAVTAEVYEVARTTWTYEGREVVGTEAGVRDGVRTDCILRLKPDRGQVGELARGMIPAMTRLPPAIGPRRLFGLLAPSKTSSPYEARLALECNPEVWPGFLQPGMSWETRAAW